MKEKLVSYNCKLPISIKSRLEEQAKLERVPMVSILQELLILGLCSRAKIKEANFKQLTALQKLQQNPIGFMENNDE